MIETARTTTVAPAATFSMIEWSCVLAGAVTAAALSLVFLTFGSAIGLAAISPWPNSGVSTRAFSALGVFWVLSQQIGAFLIGGFVAGRLRTRWADGKPDDVEFRDGLHGALVWGIGILIGAVVAISALGAATKAGTDAASRALTAASQTNADTVSYYADLALRPQVNAASQPPQAQPLPAETRSELGRLFVLSLANGSLSAVDRTYIASIVAQRTGQPLPEAEARVTQVYNEMNTTIRQAADKARRGAVLTGFVTAASLLLSLGAAWWAGQVGGRHRDNDIPAHLTAFGSSIRNLR